MFVASFFTFLQNVKFGYFRIILFLQILNTVAHHVNYNYGNNFINFFPELHRVRTMQPLTQ